MKLAIAIAAVGTLAAAVVVALNRTVVSEKICKAVDTFKAKKEKLNFPSGDCTVTGSDEIEF